MGLTRSQIAYNLSISPHRVSQLYGAEKITFVFSSDLYKRKFLEREDTNRKQINESLSKRFGINAEFDLLADLKLYTTVEKRGFLLFINEVEVKCQSEITLNGERVTLPNCEE